MREWRWNMGMRTDLIKCLAFPVFPHSGNAEVTMNTKMRKCVKDSDEYQKVDEDLR